MVCTWLLYSLSVSLSLSVLSGGQEQPCGQTGDRPEIFPSISWFFSPPVYLCLLLSIFLFFTPSLSPSLVISTVVGSLELEHGIWMKDT